MPTEPTRAGLIPLVAAALAAVWAPWIALTGENVPPAVNLALLAPTWGMLGVLALAASGPRREG